MSRPDPLHDTTPVAPPPRRTPTLRPVPVLPVRADATPLPVSASTFETRRLSAVGNERLELVPTWQERAFLAAFFGFALALAAVGVSRLGADPAVLTVAAMPLDAAAGTLAGAPAEAPSAALPLAAATVLALVAAALTGAGGRTVLDGRTRRFSRSGGALRSRRRVLEHIDFDELVGVQRLAYRIADEEARWTIHQVNLVAKDGRRVHVCSHVDEALAQRTAETIARFVGVTALPPASR